MKFGAFQISKSRNAKASRGIVIIPTPHTPLEEFPLNRPYRITAATPYMVLHQAKPCLSEDNHGTTSLLATPTILHKYNLAAQPLRIGKAPTIRNRTAPTSPSVHAKARKQVIIDTRHRQWRQRTPTASSRPNRHDQTGPPDGSGAHSSAIESFEGRGPRSPFPRSPTRVTDPHRSLSLLLTCPGFPQRNFRVDYGGWSPSRYCSVFKSVVSMLVAKTSTPYPSWASISPLEFSLQSVALPCVLAVVQGEVP